MRISPIFAFWSNNKFKRKVANPIMNSTLFNCLVGILYRIISFIAIDYRKQKFKHFFIFSTILGFFSMRAFRTELENDQAFTNGIGRFDIQTTGVDGAVVWAQSMYKNIFFKQG